MLSVKNNGLKLKIIFLSVLFITIPVIVVGVLSYRITYDIMLDTTIENASQLSNQLAKSTELSFYEIERFMSIGKNVSTIRFLLSESADERSDHLFEIIDIIDLYRSTYRFSNSVKDIKIIGQDQWFFSERKGLQSGDPAELDWYLSQFSNPDGTMIIYVLNDDEAETNGKDFKVLVGAPIYQIATNDMLGVTILELDEEPFTHFVEESKIGSEGYFSIADSNHGYLSSEGIQKGNDLSADEMTQIYENQSGSFIRKSGGSDELIFYSTINTYNWKVIGRVFVDDIMQEAQNIKTYSFTTAIIALIVAAFLNVYVTRRLFVPLDKLNQKMRLAAEGDLDVKLAHRSNDEIAQLNSSFNNMLQQIKDLIHKNMDEQKKLKQSQLRILQSQINPHFLYNTLDTIIWLINARDNEQAIEMVDALSQFFRTSLSGGKDFIAVSEELSHVQSYLTIQKNRKWDTFDYEINFDEGILKYKMMKLIIQPLVENAIYHGFTTKKAGNQICIDGRQDGEQLVFTVRDNGQGMEPQALEDLRDMLYGRSEYSESKHGYGLYNIQERIRLYYMDDYGVEIDSQPGQGTTVTLRIKKEEL